MEFIARHRRSTWTTLGILFLTAVWLLWPDGRLDQVKALQKELFSPEGKKLSADERKGKFEKLREVTKQLSSAQKQELGKERQQRFEQDLQRYSKMSKKEKAAYLDEQINRMEKARKSAGQNQGGPGGQGGAAAFFAKNNNSKGKGMSAEDRERMRKQRLDSSTPEFRAMMHQYQQDLRSRMAARGISGPRL